MTTTADEDLANYVKTVPTLALVEIYNHFLRHPATRRAEFLAWLETRKCLEGQIDECAITAWQDRHGVKAPITSVAALRVVAAGYKRVQQQTLDLVPSLSDRRLVDLALAHNVDSTGASRVLFDEIETRFTEDSYSLWLDAEIEDPNGDHFDVLTRR